MKIGHIILFSLLLVVSCLGEDGIKNYSMDYFKAVKNGASTRITLQIQDTDGNIVTGATVRTSFGKRWNDWEYHTTDTNGEVLVTGESGGKLNYGVEKTDYYETQGHYEFHGSQDGYALKAGKWQPWDSTLNLTIKQKKNPIPMYAFHGEIFVPRQGEEIGYDFKENDWVAPYGDGETADMYVYFRYEGEDLFTYSADIKLSFDVRKYDGVLSFPYDKFSKLRTFYKAPQGDYGKNILWEYERTKTRIIKETEPDDNQYFIFRTRTETNQYGAIISANYGKISGPIRCNYDVAKNKGKLRFTYYFNPEVNSRNIEFDPKQNLAPYKVSMP